MIKRPKQKENNPCAGLPSLKDFETSNLSISQSPRKVKVNHEFESLGAILKRRYQFGGIL